MQRRSFVFGLGAAGLSAGAARADFGDRIQIGALYPVRLVDAGDSARIDALVLTDGRSALGLSWRSGAALYPEDRLDLSGAGGGIGRLFRTPFRVRWREADPLGHVELIAAANLLVARVNQLGDLSGREATLGAGDYSWDLPGRFAPAPLPPSGANAGAVRMGRDGRLLVQLPQWQPQF